MDKVRGQAYISGVGSYLPEKVVSNQMLAQVLDTSDEWIQEKVGIKNRRIASDEETVSYMAYKAALKAVKNAGIQVEEIDAIIAASISYSYQMPPFSNSILDWFGLENILCLDVNAGGCCNFISSLMVAASFLNGSTIRKVLCISAEKNSDVINWADRSTAVIFGDGACAAVVDCQEQGAGVLYQKLTGRYRKSLLLPKSQIPQQPNTYLQMNGREVYQFAVESGINSILDGCQELKIGVQDVGFFIFHQANRNIIADIMKKLDIPAEKTCLVLAEYGNTAGASVGIALEQALVTGKINEGMIVALVAFGGGLNECAMFWQWHKSK